MHKPPERTEHRRFTRVPFQASVRLHSSDGVEQGELLDISLKGILIARPLDWSPRIGEPVEIEIALADSDVMIRMQATLAHLEAERAGFTCHHIDLDSASHLRRLIELNLGNETQLQRELHAMITSG
jgi:PilZ domain